MRSPIGRLSEWFDAQSFGGVEAYRRYRRTGSVEPPEPGFDAVANGLVYDREVGLWHPTVKRPCLYPIVEAENGHIVLHPRDWQSAMLVIGAQGSGKSSLVLRHYLNAIQDVRGAVVLVDPKRTIALRALAYTPWLCGKRVWYLNLRRPAFGMSPMRLRTDPQAVMGAVVDGLCDAFPDELYQSSREIIQYAVLAALALAKAEGRAPRIEDVFHLLVWENEELRRRAIAACSRISNGDLVRDHYARHLPGDMARAASDTSSRMRAPRNKLAALLQADSLRVFFNHTTEKPLEEIIADRDILIVDADLGEGGRENSRVMIHFILRMLDSVLLRQQGMGKDQATKVHLIIDEAGRVLNEHIMGMVDTHREVGFDVLAALHYMDQLKPEVLKGALNLFRQKYIFRISETGDAKRLADDVSGMVYDSLGRRTQASIWPDAPKELGDHYCLVSHLVSGRPSETFLGRTYPMADDSLAGWRPAWHGWLQQQVGEYPEHILWTLRDEQTSETTAAGDTGRAATANGNGASAVPAGQPLGASQPAVESPRGDGRDAGDGTGNDTAASPKDGNKTSVRAGRRVERLHDARRLAGAAKLEVSVARLEIAAFGSLGVDPDELREKHGVRAPRAIVELAAIDRILYRTAEPLEDEESEPLPRLSDPDLQALDGLDRLGLMSAEQLGRLC